MKRTRKRNTYLINISFSRSTVSRIRYALIQTSSSVVWRSRVVARMQKQLVSGFKCKFHSKQQEKARKNPRALLRKSTKSTIECPSVPIWQKAK
ncbi:hypothetical protein TNCV_1400431 [Trichonephila clavipes]|nr:hypothetical protein TNCV_1400431 [Trichonephila clavipes]